MSKVIVELERSVSDRRSDVIDVTWNQSGVSYKGKARLVDHGNGRATLELPPESGSGRNQLNVRKTISSQRGERPDSFPVAPFIHKDFL